MIVKMIVKARHIQWLVYVVCGVLLSPELAFGARVLCVNTDGTAIRNERSTRAMKLFEVQRYTPLTVIGSFKQKVKEVETVTWYQVKDYDGETGWVYHQLLDKAVRCGIIKSDKPVIQSKTTLKDKRPEMIRIPKYTPFKIITERWGWLQIETADKKIRWIPKSETWSP